MTTGAQRSGDARGDFLNCMPPTKFLYWAVTCGGYCYWLYAVCDVAITFANQSFGEVGWHNIHTILHTLSLLVVEQWFPTGEEFLAREGFHEFRGGISTYS